DNPKNKAQVDILVPNGEIIEQKQVSSGTGFEATVNANSLLFVSQASTNLEGGPIPTQMVPFTGAARTERLPAGGGAAYVSAQFQTTFGTTRTTTTRLGVDNISEFHNSSFASTTTGVSGISVGQTIQAGLFLSLRSELNAF